jgi:hypothetical protein
VIALLDAVDAAQRDGTDADARVPWDAHVLKSAAHKAYVPFTVSLDGLNDAFKAGAIYVRAVSRPRNLAAVEQHSELRGWLRGAQPTFRSGEAISVGGGEMPVGGPGVSSSRRGIQAAAESSAVLELQRRAMERDKADAEAAKKRIEERDPSLFPFEEYYFFDAKSFRGRAHREIGRAIPLAAGEYDLYIAMLDRGDRGPKKGERPIILERRVTVPDFWNDELRLSSLILTSDMEMLKTPPAAKDRGEQPYTFGLAAVSPSLTQIFSTADVLTIVYQICNYGSPDADLTAAYRFYRVDEGPRRLFNSTQPQLFDDDDLPPSTPWETQAFTMQLVPLASFPPGAYELEVIVHDRLTRADAKGVAAFRVRDRQ